MYLNDWKDVEIEGVKSDFCIDDSKLSGAEIILASYTYEDYNGSAFVLFRKDGKLFEVNGGHCSCYGLEDQWDPEETTAEALLSRIHSYEFEGLRDELRQVLGDLRP